EPAARLRIAREDRLGLRRGHDTVADPARRLLPQASREARHDRTCPPACHSSAGRLSLEKKSAYCPGVLDLVLRNCRLPERAVPVDLAISDGRIAAAGAPPRPAQPR